MTGQAKAVIGGLAAVVVALSVTLGLALASANDDDMPHMNSAADAHLGMAMGSMDSDEMLTQMREIFGAEGYESMLEHNADHQHDGSMAGPGMDGMMQQMMDAMMRQMPADRHHVIPIGPR